MSLTLMYITNNPKVAEIAQSAGVDRIWVDMEWIGKEDRQAGMNTVKSHHTIEDIVNLRPIVTSSTLMARINPIHSATKEYGDSREEIESTIAAGAEVMSTGGIQNQNGVVIGVCRRCNVFCGYGSGKGEEHGQKQTEDQAFFHCFSPYK